MRTIQLFGNAAELVDNKRSDDEEENPLESFLLKELTYKEQRESVSKVH